MLSCRREMSAPSQEWTLKSSARSRGTNSSSRLSNFRQNRVFPRPSCGGDPSIARTRPSRLPNAPVPRAGGMSRSMLSEKLCPSEKHAQCIRSLNAQDSIFCRRLQSDLRIVVQRSELHPLDCTEAGYEPVGLSYGRNCNRLAVQFNLERCLQRSLRI